MNKQKKPFITRMRMFIAAGSLVGMVGGWALLAQADTPASTANSTAAIVASAPVQSADFGLATGTTPAAAATATPAASSTAAASATATSTASTSTSTATATKVTTTTKLPVLRTRSS